MENITTELNELPAKIGDCMRRMADALRNQEILELNMRWRMAVLDQEYRKDPHKRLEKDIESAIRLDPQVVDWRKRLVNAKYNVNILIAEREMLFAKLKVLTSEQPIF